MHGIDLGMFQYPVVAEMSNMQGYNEFRKAMENAGQTIVGSYHHAAAFRGSLDHPRMRVCQPASSILDKARDIEADLVVIGARGQGRVGELVFGSVSHRVALHADCSTLIVKDRSGPVKRVVVAVEGQEDGARIKAWLLAHPFKTRWTSPSSASCVRSPPPIRSAFFQSKTGRISPGVGRGFGEGPGGGGHASPIHRRHTGHRGGSDRHSDRNALDQRT